MFSVVVECGPRAPTSAELIVNVPRKYCVCHVDYSNLLTNIYFYKKLLLSVVLRVVVLVRFLVDLTRTRQD